MFKSALKKLNTAEGLIIFTGHLSFAIILIFAAVFYKERIFFSDSAFQFFKIVNFEKINIEASRYGAVIPQLPVLLAIKFGFNLKYLTITYSLSFVLLYYFVFIFCVHWLKHLAAGFSLIIVLVLCISQSFYHPVTETHQSLVFCIFFYAILTSGKIKITYLKYVLATLLIGLAFLTHPVALYPLTFLIGYFAIDRNKLKTFAPYYLLVIVVTIAFTKVLLTSQDSYEGKFFSELMHSPSILFNIANEYSTYFFLTKAGKLYFWTILLEILLIIVLLMNKKWQVLIWQLCSVSFFMVITFLTYHQGDSDLLMERAFMPLALFIAVPFVQEILYAKKKLAIIGTALIVVIISLSLSRIYRQGNFFKNRTAINQELLWKTAQFNNRKFIIQQNELGVFTFWSHSFETILLSAITDKMPTQTIYPSNNIESLTKYTKNTNSVFLGTDFWLEWDIKSLNQKYFDLPDDRPYKVIKLDDL